MAIAFVATASVALLLSIAGHRPTANDAHRRNATAQVALSSERLKQYASQHGPLPATLNELVESYGTEGPYVREKDLIDSYGHAFVYAVPGAHGAFDLIYLGKDGKAGGDGYDADFGNWELVNSQ